MSSPAVVLRNVSKSFDGVRVLHGVDLSILAGEVHGLVGENGSGKSTLVKILGGVYAPDRGAAIRLRNQPVPLPVRNPQRNGLAIIHQDLALCESMSVADNDPTRAAVVVFSSDIEEVAQLCHRVLIMRYGTVSAELSPGEVTEERIHALAQRAEATEPTGPRRS